MEVNTTTIPPEYFNRYLPYTEAEYKELKEVMDSAAGHWKRAADTIRDFINKVETTNE